MNDCFLLSERKNSFAVYCENVGLAARKKSILKGVNFFAEKGTVTVLLGKNGSGKTSLLRCLCGIRKANEGLILLNGIPLKEMSNSSRAEKVALLPQFLPQLHLSVRELVAMGRSPYLGAGGKLSGKDKEIIFYAVNRAGIENHLDDIVCTLSGGERQLAFLAMTLAQDTDLVLLDEPTSSLDSEYRIRVYDIVSNLKKSGRTVVVTLHNLDEALAIADNFVVLDDGKSVFCGDKTDFLATNISQSIFGLNPVKVYDSDGKELLIFRHG